MSIRSLVYGLFLAASVGSSGCCFWHHHRCCCYAPAPAVRVLPPAAP